MLPETKHISTIEIFSRFLLFEGTMCGLRVLMLLQCLLLVRGESSAPNARSASKAADTLDAKEATSVTGSKMDALLKRQDSSVEDLFRSTTTIFGLNGKSYLYVKETRGWADAREFCKGWGGDLASITSREMFDGVIAGMKFGAGVATPGRCVWLGGRHSGNDKMMGWKWVSGDSLAGDDKLWNRPVEPEGGKHDRVIIARPQTANHKPVLQDFSRNGRCFFLCQI